MYEAFDRARARLDLRQVCERYGVEFNHAGFARCPFHSERTGSFTVRRSRAGRQYFRCFGCGAHGDAFDFVGQLFGISEKLEQLRRLNDDFMLGLDLDHRQTREERRQQAAAAAERQRRRALQDSFVKWTERACVAVCAYVRTLRRWRVWYAVMSRRETVHPLFEYALRHISRAEELARIFTESNTAELLAVYKFNREEVENIVRFISGYNAE